MRSEDARKEHSQHTADNGIISDEWNEITREEHEKKMIYGVRDDPPVYTCAVYGLQQALMCVLGTMSVPFIVSNAICAQELPEVRAQLMSITFFMCGVATLLQTTVGVRLPIIQGGSHSFLPPIIVMMQLDRWRCPAKDEVGPDDEEPWLARTREIQGGLILASLTQVLLGCSGLVGVAMRFVGPLTVAPTLALIGLGFYSAAVNHYAEKQWGIAAFTAGVLLVCSLWMHKVLLPVPSCSRQRGCHVIRFPFFTLMSVLLAVGLGWLLCFVLTAADLLPTNATSPAYFARTDINLHVVDSTSWFTFPYPFQFGLPTFSLAGFVALVVPTFSSIVESVGDYYACARVSETPPPPPHAVNRGIAIEGVSSILSGMMGASHGTTSYSGNIAAISITRVASRRVFQSAAVILVLMGVVTKFGAVMSLIPDPVLGGLNAMLLGTLVGVAIATLRFVDLTSQRNLTVMGLALLLGLSVPEWVNGSPGRINTGSPEADHALSVLLATPLFVGGMVGFILDNIVPGTLKERGITAWQHTTSPLGAEVHNHRDSPSNRRSSLVESIYDIPLVTRVLKRFSVFRYIPVSPTFQGVRVAVPCRKTPKGDNSKTSASHDNLAFRGDATSF
ncbi:hypothetical protein C0Q70_09245 [Pomacea canaliculata]|uniref:Solute carrier family 23 member 2 n=2 Tax=Pomacea canaliculata TaxID=400727 RepID=A0A2T7P987_POMCA|nr:hypothetical protein C0Q70_09245 [Pomacea canaliculata]